MGQEDVGGVLARRQLLVRSELLERRLVQLHNHILGVRDQVEPCCGPPASADAALDVVGVAILAPLLALVILIPIIRHTPAIAPSTIVRSHHGASDQKGGAKPKTKKINGKVAQF